MKMIKDFLCGDFMEELSPLVETMRGLVATGESLENIAQKELLEKLYSCWNESENDRVVSQCISLLCLALHLFPTEQEVLIQQLLVGADAEYHFHKNVIYDVIASIELFPIESQPKILSQLIAYLKHPSNQVRQLVVRIIGKFLKQFPEIIEPVLRQVMNEDPDQDDVVRFAKDFLKVESYDGETGGDFVGVGRVVVVEHFVAAQHSESPKVQHQVLKQLSVQELSIKLLNFDRQQSTYSECKILEKLADRFYDLKDIDEQVSIINAIANYILIADFPIFLHFNVRRYIGEIIYNADRRKLPIRQIHYALVSRVLEERESWENIAFILDLLGNNGFNFMMVHTVPWIVCQFNKPLFEHERLRYTIEEFFNYAFELFFARADMQNEAFIRALGAIKGNSVTTGLVLESLISFLRSILLDISSFSISIKKEAICVLSVLAKNTKYLSSQVSILDILHHFSISSLIVEIQRHTKDILCELLSEQSIFSLAAMAIQLNGIDNIIDWSKVSRPDEISDQDWQMFVLQCEYKSRHYQVCINLAKQLTNEYIAGDIVLSPTVHWVEARAYRELGLLDESLSSLRFLGGKWPFNPIITQLQAEIFYLKRQVRRAKRIIQEITDGCFPNFHGFSPYKLNRLARESESHSVIVYQPKQAAINIIFENMNALITLLKSEAQDSDIEDSFSMLLKNLQDVFGRELVDICQDNYGFKLSRIKIFEYPCQRERFLRQFVQYCIRQRVDHYYHAQYHVFKSREDYQSNLVAQLQDSQLTEIYQRVHKRAISVEGLLEMLVKLNVETLPIFDFIKKYSLCQKIIGSFTLGIDYDFARGYDIFISIFGLQCWEATYGEFDIQDKNTIVHTPEFLRCMVNDAKQRKTIFFVPSNIGDASNVPNAEQSSVTYREIEWIIDKLEKNPSILRQFIFVFDAYDSLPYYILRRDEEGEVDLGDSLAAIEQFIEKDILSDEEILQFRQMRERADNSLSKQRLEQYDLLFEWIREVDYSQFNPSAMDSFKLIALKVVRELLLDYFNSRDADQLIQQIIHFSTSRSSAEQAWLKERIQNFVEVEDFDAVMGLSVAHKAALRELQFDPQPALSPTYQAGTSSSLFGSFSISGSTDSSRCLTPQSP